MTPDDFRRLALALPDAIEVGHMDHPDFRVGGKVFATLGYPTDEWAMVKLGPDEQLALCAAKPKIFVPVKGAWGSRRRDERPARCRKREGRSRGPQPCIHAIAI
jgi:hypothetical protein